MIIFFSFHSLFFFHTFYSNYSLLFDFFSFFIFSFSFFFLIFSSLIMCLPIRQILQKPDLVGQTVAWALKLSEFHLKYENRTPIKAQVLANFIAKMVDETLTCEVKDWSFHVDGSSNLQGSGAGVILESLNAVRVILSMKFAFSASNN